MRRYETIFILRPTLAEKEIDNVVDNTSTIINDDGGSIIELDRWGMRQLAYLVKKEKQGFYVFVDYCTTPQSVAEIERKFRIDDSVLKYMTVKISESLSEEELASAKGEVEEKKAAVKAAEEAALAESEAAGSKEEIKTDSTVDSDEKSGEEKKTEKETVDE